MIVTRKALFLIATFLSVAIFATEYFLDPNNEYVYEILEGFEAIYDETDQSLSVVNENLNISKLSEPVEGLELQMLTQGVQKNLEESGFKILSIDERNFQSYAATTFETLAIQDGIPVHIEFTIFEVPNRGFYLIVAAAPDEVYEDVRMLMMAAKQMLMFVE